MKTIGQQIGKRRRR